VDAARVARVLQMLQSTSPSYILMASLDLARMQMATEGRKLLAKAIDLAEEARRRINRIPGLRCLEAREVEAWADFRLDVTKLTISVKELGFTGYEASALLNSECDIQVEMADLWNILVIVSIGDRRDDLLRLVGGLETLARRRGAASRRPVLTTMPPMPSLQDAALACTPREAYFGPSGYMPLSRATGRISSDIVTIYPPGIPVVVPGETFTPETVEYLRFMGAHGARIDGVLDSPGGEEPGELAPPDPRVRVLTA
jgi:lysine decarboxylase